MQLLAQNPFKYINNILNALVLVAENKQLSSLAVVIAVVACCEVGLGSAWQVMADSGSPLPA